MNEVKAGGLTLPVRKCRFCKHEWVPRVPNPRACPACRRREP